MITYRTLACLLCLLAVLCVPAAFAQLDCAANPNILKTTIEGIVNKLDYHSISFNGTCNGPIIIRGFRDLYIAGAAGGAKIQSAGPAAVVNITASQNVTLSNLGINGGGGSGVLVAANDSKEVKIYTATLDNGGMGVVCGFGSWCWVWDVDITNISGPALFADGQSKFDVGVPTSVSAKAVKISDCGHGIQATERSQVNIDGNFLLSAMKPNAYGIDASASQVRTRNCTGTKSISGSGRGVSIERNSEFLADCPITIEGNQTGLIATASYVNLGLNVTVQNNGVSGRPDGPGGVLAGHGSVIDIGAAKLINNIGYGLVLTQNTTGWIAGATQITGNGGNGISVRQRAALQLLPGYTISGNGALDLVCAVQGTAYGDASGINKKMMDCKTFEPLP